MQLRKNRWSKVYESSEEELTSFLESRQISADRQTLPMFEQLDEQTLLVDTNIYLAEGSASFVADDRQYSMQPGDVMYLPVTTRLVITAGMSGCVYYVSTARST